MHAAGSKRWRPDNDGFALRESWTVDLTYFDPRLAARARKFEDVG